MISKSVIKKRPVQPAFFIYDGKESLLIGF